MESGVSHLSATHFYQKMKKEAAKKFLKKDHHDSNMLVSIRIRPLNPREIANTDQEIIRSEDKLLVS